MSDMPPTRRNWSDFKDHRVEPFFFKIGCRDPEMPADDGIRSSL
jgi:hypothetical protein